jgi:hypothetical protein
MLSAVVLTVLYLADWALTTYASFHVVGFHELNPLGFGILPKLTGVALVWTGVWQLQGNGRFAMLLWSFALVYFAVDAYQVVMLL